MTAEALRRSMAVRWIQRKASGSVIRRWVISSPLARSISLRDSSRRLAASTSAANRRISA
jgi:hypothetical protein